jgi:hypothetical protein
MALKWESKILLVKIETSYGTDPTPAGANGILAKDIKLTPMEGSDVDRELELPYFGAQGTIPTDLHATISFMVELAPSGTAGTAPLWGPVLRACGVAEVIDAGTAVTYNPVTDDLESATIYLFIEKTLYAMTGARGTVKMEINASGIPYLNFAMTGLFIDPEESTRIAPSLAGFQKPLAASKTNTPTFTIDEVAVVMRSFVLDLANEVEPRFLIGAEGIIITDRKDAITTTVEAVPLSTLDPYALAKSQTDVPVVLEHGRIAGHIATLTVPKAQMQRPEGLANAQKIVEWPLRLAPLPTAGNDQWSLTLT